MQPHLGFEAAATTGWGNIALQNVMRTVPQNCHDGP
jgi:hypothetical protein